MASTSNFDRTFDELIANEGGLVDHPNDPGGITKWGVSLRYLKGLHPHTFLSLFPGKAPTTDLVRGLTTEDARKVFRFSFWNALALDDFSFDVAREAADFAYNAGNKQAAKTMQRAFNWTVRRRINKPAADLSFLKPVAPLVVDGIIGPNSRHHIQQLIYHIGDDAYLQAFEMFRKQFYQNLVDRNPRQYSPFLKGWLRRAEVTDTPDLNPEIEGNTNG